MEKRTIVIFDGVCNLCNGAVQFILKWEKRPTLTFTALQSESAQKLLIDFKHVKIEDSILLIKDGHLYQQSTAVLIITEYLKWFWVLKFLIYFPIKLRDRIYNWIARNRYRWFGKRNQCMVPTEDLKSRFI